MSAKKKPVKRSVKKKVAAAKKAARTRARKKVNHLPPPQTPLAERQAADEQMEA